MSKIIDLSNRKITHVTAKEAKIKAVKERNITSITLRGSEIQGDSTAALGYIYDVIGSSRTITSIDFGNIGPALIDNRIADKDSWDMFLVGINNNPITSLDLSKTRLADDQILTLGKEIAGKNAQINLNLADVRVEDINYPPKLYDAIKALTSNNALAFLNLSGACGNQAYKFRVDLKTLGKNIIELNLSNLGLIRPEVTELAQGLQGHGSIRRLDLGGNKIATISPDSAETSKEFSTLVEAVAASKTLEHIGLASTGLAFDGCLLFFTALQQNNNTTLVSIDLSNNPYSWMQRPWDDSPLFKFEQALKWKSQTLDYLNLSGSLLDNNKIDFFMGRALKQNKIKVLDLSNCRGFNDKVFDNLSSAFLSPSLEEVNLSSNSFNDNEKGCRWYKEEFYDRFEHHPTFVLSHTQKVHQWFFNRGYIAEMAEVAKVLHIRNVVTLVEEYAKNGNPSKLFVVLGSSKAKAVISQESNNNNNNNNDGNPSKSPVSSQKVSVISSQESNDNSPNVPKIVPAIGDFYLEAVDISLMGDFSFNIDMSGVTMDGGIF